MSKPLILALIVAAIVLTALVSSTLYARRLDRLHRTVVKTRKALERALTARAQLALSYAQSGALDVPASVLLADAANSALDCATEDLIDDGLDVIGPQFASVYQVRARLAGDIAPSRPAETSESPERDRRAVESALSRTLRLTVDAAPEREARHDELFAELERACLDVRMLRSFHNNHVAHIQRLRRSRLTHMFKLAGWAPMPISIDMDDE